MKRIAMALIPSCKESCRRQVWQKRQEAFKLFLTKSKIIKDYSRAQGENFKQDKKKKS